MAGNDMFRVALFGGFHKGDVQEYIESMENEIEAVKVLHAKEKNELVRQMEEKDRQSEESQKEMLELRERIRKFEEAEEARKEEIKELGELKETAEAREREIGELKKYTEELEKKIEKYKTDNDQGMFDYETIAKVLRDANHNAELIREEAEAEGKKIIEAAVLSAESQKDIIKKRMESELEEKGIQLVAAKHKIMQYVKEMDSAHQGLYSIYHRMNKMAENMPVRFDDYWEGEEFLELEADEPEADESNKGEKTD